MTNVLHKGKDLPPLSISQLDDMYSPGKASKDFPQKTLKVSRQKTSKRCYLQKEVRLPPEFPRMSSKKQPSLQKQ